jgi:hypothetical protein
MDQKKSQKYIKPIIQLLNFDYDSSVTNISEISDSDIWQPADPNAL